MIRFLPVVLISMLLSTIVYSREDTCRLRISLLTCAPGGELYSIFGHTALRVQDPSTGADEVFNYGTFEFGPDFYIQFIKGKLLYFLSVENYMDFIRQYRYESRSIREQDLQLSCTEEKKLYAALLVNAQEQNRYYKYDFLFDNCTTRAGDMVAAHTDTPVVFKNILPPDIPTFRNLIHSYLDAGHQPWSKLGIDILLGARLDRKVTNREAMFLPDYLLKGFDSAQVNRRSLVTPPRTILPMPSLLTRKPVFTPAVVFGIVLAMALVLSFAGKGRTKGMLSVFDFLFFFILGLAGILLLFMWFGTDHKVCQNNYNLLWALPTHVVTAFFVHSRKLWVKKYFRVVFWTGIALLLTWFFLPQEMNNGLVPIVLLSVIRSWDLSKNKLYAPGRNHN